MTVSLFKYIKQGVGWELGRRAVKEGLERLNETEEEQQQQQQQQQSRAWSSARRDPDPDQPVPKQDETRGQTTAARIEAQRRQAAASRELKAREIDDELAALKRRLAMEGRLPKGE